MTIIFNVCIPNTSRDCFDYLADQDEPAIGARVWVPFRNLTRLGVVVGCQQVDHPRATLKCITAIIDKTPLFSSDMLVLCEWVSRYYHSPLSEVLPLALPKKYRLGNSCVLPVEPYFGLVIGAAQAKEALSAKAHRQHALLDFFIQHANPVSKKMLSKAGFKSPQIASLISMGLVSALNNMPQLPHLQGLRNAPLQLNDEQSIAVAAVANHLHAYKCFLLQGVTGSGKTEVYLQLIAKVLAAQAQVLILVPEIGLTPQLLSRFEERFYEPMAVIHSHLNDTERQVAWQKAMDNQVKIVIGTRAAIFTPMPSLGLIIIDEEHDASLKQMDGVRYSARDTALMRAHMKNIPIVLGSATPSLESMHNCRLNKYTQLRLNQKALASNPLHYQILDIRNQLLEHGLASKTVALIDKHLKQHNQVLVFINRRGFAPVVLCHQCGWMADCKACDSHLTMHKSISRLVCHHCGLTQRMPSHCHRCKSVELLPVGAGTQRIQAFLSARFPQINIVRIDRDEVRKKKALEEQLARISSGEAQLIIGTQMLAKGHHFPRLTLVVVLDTDNGFYNQDFRALERLGQLLTQVSGRAGRAEFPGQVLIQTHLPQHPLLNLLIQQGYDAFAQALLVSRQEANLPPFYFLAVIRAQGKYLPDVLAFLKLIKEFLGNSPVETLGPAPAPLARKAENHRMQLLIKAPSRAYLKAALSLMMDSLRLNKIKQSVRWSIDVDPIDLF